MVLNVIKGPYPSLTQVDKDALLSTDETVAVERGSLLKIDASGNWRVCQDTDAGDSTHPGAFAFFAFMPDTDLTAQMAGGYPVNGNQPPKLAGLAVSPTNEIETDMYNTTNGTPALGDFLTHGVDGKLTVHTDGCTALARVTKAPATRWVNNAVAVSGWRLGNNVSVIRGLTMYLPCVPGTDTPAIA